MYEMTYFLWAIGAAAYNALVCPVTPGGTGETTIAAKAAGVATGNQIIGRKVEVYSGVRVNADLGIRYTSVSVLSICSILYLQSKQRTHTHTQRYTHVQSVAHIQRRAVQRSCVEIDKQQSDKNQFVSCVTALFLFLFIFFWKAQEMIEQGLLTRSDIASTAPNAQQEPQDPWSRISPMVGQLGQAVRASNSSGIAAPLSSTKSDSTSRLSGSLNLCASGWTPINPRIWWSGKSASKLRPTCVRESLMRICCHVSNSNLNKIKKKKNTHLQFARCNLHLPSMFWPCCAPT